jgi:hypothetical protein
MNEEKKSTKNQKKVKSSTELVKKGVVSNEVDFKIPYEAACSPEFIDGCILREDEEDKELEEK